MKKIKPNYFNLKLDQTGSDVLFRLSNLPITNVLIYAFLFLLPTQLGKHFFFDFSYALGLRVDYLAIAIYLTDILALVLFFVFRKEIVKTMRVHWKTLAIITLLFGIGTFFSERPAIALFRFIKLAEAMGIFVVFKNAAIDKTRLFSAFAFGAALQLVLVVFQLKTGHSLQGLAYFLGERRLYVGAPGVATISLAGQMVLRPYATFSHPNSLAGFYLLLYTFALYLPSLKKISNFKFQISNLALSSMLVFLSFSKIAIITLFSLTALHTVFERKGCLPCRAATLFVFLGLSAFFLSAVGDPESLSKRILLNQDSLTIIKENLLWGVGLGQYILSQAKIPSAYPYFFLQPVHNIFLLFLAETGIILTGAVLFLLGKFVWASRQNKTLMACFLVVVFTGLFDHYWLTLQQNLLLLGVVFGIINSQAYASRTD